MTLTWLASSSRRGFFPWASGLNVSARAYTEAGLPWFDYYDADAGDLPPSQALSDVKPVGEWLGEDPDLEGLQQAKWIVPVGPDKKGAPVSDGDW